MGKLRSENRSEAVPSRLGKLADQIRKKLFVLSIAASLVGLASIVTLQFYRHNMLGTGLLLGWDSSGYVWSAKNIVRYGPVFMIQHWGFPNLYIQLLALFGYFSNNFALMETILPLMFATLLVYASSRCTQEITGSVYAACLNVFLTTLSLNTLRLFSDLHRNLMALSLSLVMMLWFSRSRDEKLVLSKRYLIIAIAFFLIASTHFETYVLLTATLLLHTVLTREYRKVVSWILPAAIPSAVMIPMLLSKAFFSSWGSEFAIGNSLRLDEIVLWLGGSVFLCLFLALGAIYLLYRSIKYRNDLSQLMLLWIIVIMGLAFMIESGILPFSHEVSFRLLLTVPVSMLLSLSAMAAVRGTRNVKLKFRIFSTRKDHPLSLSVQKIAVVLVLLLMVNTAFVAFQHIDYYLTPYIPNSAYMKILETKDYFDVNQLKTPVVIFYGEPAIWHGWLFRTYIGAELGEHFAYYGEFEKLLDFAPLNNDHESQTEVALSNAWYNEMLGRYNTMWPHFSLITSIEDLRLHPLVVISPDLYYGKIPYYLKPFYIGQGIYVIPPGTLSETNRTLYGPSVTLLRNGVSLQTRSEYLNIDPGDPSVVYVMVEALSGSESFEVTNFPSNWILYSVTQGGDLSFPEENPTRLDGSPAVFGNDPAEKLNVWIPVAINGTVFSDTNTRKEGTSSLKVSGAFDSWGNLGALYDGMGVLNLTQSNSLAVWAKSSEPATFSMDLIDIYGNARTYWSMTASDGSSSITAWKRFTVQLDQFSSERGAFDINVVDKIFLYAWNDKGQGKSITLWIDDLTLDNLGDFRTYVRKGRVLPDDFVVFYFKEKQD
jgi:hypothetical protein